MKNMFGIELGASLGFIELEITLSGFGFDFYLFRWVETHRCGSITPLGYYRFLIKKSQKKRKGFLLYRCVLAQRKTIKPIAVVILDHWTNAFF